MCTVSLWQCTWGALYLFCPLSMKNLRKKIFSMSLENLLCLWNILSMKWLIYEMTCLWNVLSMKWYKMSIKCPNATEMFPHLKFKNLESFIIYFFLGGGRIFYAYTLFYNMKLGEFLCREYLEVDRYFSARSGSLDVRIRFAKILRIWPDFYQSYVTWSIVILWWWLCTR